MTIDRKITRKIRRASIYILCCILACILMLDFMLWHVDPLGVVTWHYTFRAQHEVMAYHPTGFAYTTGEHWFYTYSATILADGSRRVPDTNMNADCTIVFVGDSVTFGQGVNDKDTWINQLAQRFPDVHFINSGRSAYSVGNVLLAKDYYVGDGYIWMLVGNDAEPTFFYDGSRPSANQPSATRIYLNWFLSRPGKGFDRQATDEYWQAVDTIATDNTLILAVDSDPLAFETRERYPVHIIPRWTHSLSVADGHADTQGNQEIADNTLPFVEPFISRVCND